MVGTTCTPARPRAAGAAALLLALVLPAGAVAAGSPGARIASAKPNFVRPLPHDLDTVQSAVDAWRADREAAILEDFVRLLSIPNVASNLSDMERNADHIAGLLKARGFTTQTLRAGGAPYVYAELTVPNATETVLIYAHFDGQPVQEGVRLDFDDPIVMGRLPPAVALSAVPRSPRSGRSVDSSARQ